MARRTRTTTTTTRAAAGGRQATSRKRTTVTAAGDEDEEEPGIGIDGGMAIATTVLLLAAILFLDYHLGTTYGAGLFFK